MSWDPCHLTRIAGLLAVAVILSACAQAMDEVRVRVGVGLDQIRPARDYAALYLPYAQMASIAYTDEPYLVPAGRPRGFCPDLHRLKTVPPVTDDQRRRNPLNLNWLRELEKRGWHCEFGSLDVRNCPPLSVGCELLPGLELHVWRRGCEFAIAFRGTDADDRGDFLSNVRWFARLPNRLDEYDQVRITIDNIVDRIRTACPSAQIVSVGHSLGGGLAQHAAYGRHDIRYVYAFDSSPVTGVFDFVKDGYLATQIGLGIDRINEGGELLEIVRLIIGGFTHPSLCNPRIRTVRFNYVQGSSPLVQHSMTDLTKTMSALSVGGKESNAKALTAARNCTFVDSNSGI